MTTTTTTTTARPGTDATAPADTLTAPRGARRVTRRDMHDAVAELAPFRYNASASGMWATVAAVRFRVGGMGCHLPAAERARLAEMLAELDPAAPVYVVKSYETVIAVRAESGAWWTWEDRCSATTTTHQTAVRRGIAARDGR